MAISIQSTIAAHKPAQYPPHTTSATQSVQTQRQYNTRQLQPIIVANHREIDPILRKYWLMDGSNRLRTG